MSRNMHIKLEVSSFSRFGAICTHLTPKEFRGNATLQPAITASTVLCYCVAQYSLNCADVPLRNYSTNHSRNPCHAPFP